MSLVKSGPTWVAVLLVALLAGTVPAGAQPHPHRAPDRQAEARAWGRQVGDTATAALVDRVIGADQLARRGYTGAGVGVALIDTGVAPVPGLEDVWHGPDLSFESVHPATRHLDTYGHGTHLAGLITGDRQGEFEGVAPDSTLVSLKVGAHNGAVDVTQVIAAVDWVTQHRDEHDIRVLVLTYGTDGAQPHDLDPLAHAVENAWRHGIVVVTAAGNHGAELGRLVNPAIDPYVLAVAAADLRGTARTNDDVTPDFSARGDGVREPDLSAPGVNVLSLRDPGSFLDEAYPEARRGEALFRGSGTSQAAAITGGAVALLLQARPDLTPDEVKALLVGTAARMPSGDPVAAGAGMLDIGRALLRPVPRGATQTWPASTGLGSVELARGSSHVADEGVELVGELDILGQPWDAPTWAAASFAGRTWAGGDWNGRTWAGSTWSGRTWAAADWTGRTWAGRTWASTEWAGRTWAGRTWAGRTWAGDTWLGRTWAGRTWASFRW